MTNKHPLADCDGCPLQRKDAAYTTGPEDAEVVLVSRSPGRKDVEKGKPFSGMSGVVVDHLLEENGYKREQIKTTNIVLCETEDPPKEAIKRCKPRLDADLATAKTIIAAGAEPAREIVKSTLQKGRGIVHDRIGDGARLQRVIVTNNPAAVIRDSDNFPNLVADFRLALNPPPPLTLPNVDVLDSRRSALAAIRDLGSRELLASDLEGHRPHIECAGFSFKEDHAYVFTRKSIEECWSELKELWTRPIDYVWHNGIYDVKLLKDNGINGHISHDTFAMSYVLDERPGTHSLGYLLRLYLGWPNYEPESVDRYKETGILPDDIYELLTYNGTDTGGTLQLFNVLKEKIVEDEVEELYRRQYVPFFNALTDIERRGFVYDAEKAADLNEEVVIPLLRELTGELGKIAGAELYNPMSTKQTRAIVYEQWGLKHKLRDSGKKKRQTGFDKDVRREIREGRFDSKPRARDKLIEFATVYDRFRSIETQRGTFIEGLIKRTTDGRLYCEFNPCGTVTGRTSSRNPNFQNITREARDVIPGVRGLFYPSPGNLIVSADYSQAELRFISVMSGSKAMQQIYTDSTRSLHKETAAKFYGENYTKEEYVKSKNINFGVCYLQSAESFAQMYTMPVDEARAYIGTWFDTFPEIVEWISEVRERIETDNVLVSPFGSKRRFHLITRENMNDLHREGVNFLPQNSAGQLTISAIIELWKLGIPVISTVHDSIIADVPEDEVTDVAKVMKDVMERMPAERLDMSLPFKVDVSVGETWGTVEEMEVNLVAA